VSLARLEGYRRAGVNRLSLGVQSLAEALLLRLGRLHSPREAESAFEAARAAGIANVNVDVMYGLPDLDSPTWEATLRRVLAWRPEHVSAYCLTLDEGSRWARDLPGGLPSEDAVTEQYWLLARLAPEAGLEHYEISNYCRPGFQCRHNLLYWRGDEYVGLGPGGSGHLGGVRYTNVKPVQRYCSALEAGAFPLAQWERLTARQRQAERLILGLRLREGVPRTWLDARVADGPADVATIVGRWGAEGFLIADEGRVRLTEAGFLLSDSLFVDLL
jgi:oxygen-independent coproporphyrinogen-3 oxidase